MIYDAFQQKAIDYIKDGQSVIVSAPTGAGKTVIAEYIINDCLLKGDRVIYTAPIKALSNQKFRDFQENFPDKIGILTGDVSINPFAPILIMTTEIFRNKVLEEESNLGNYSWIIFDEIHYLDDFERGSVWEESLIFLPNHMKMLALSATIPNIDEMSSWLQSIHKKPLKIVKESKRPVPLHFFYHVGGEILDNLHKVNSTFYKKRSFQHRHRSPNKPTLLIKDLYEKNKLPCIYFVFGRKRAEYLANEMLMFNFLDKDERFKITELYNKLCEKFEIQNDKSAESLLPLIEKGVAYHHAGMLPTLKEVIERLFTSRLLKVIFTTETFALGINMPARTVIFDELRKFYGKGFATLKTRDFYQMAGRAGRRSIDKEGFVYSRVNPHWISFPELHRVIYGSPEKVKSRFNASYATILNLYDKYKERLYDIYPLSFHYFQAKKQLRRKAVENLRNKVKLLKELGYIRKNSLTEKGKFAAKVYGYELSLSEIYEKGILENLNEIEIGILCAALVFEPRKGSTLPSLSGATRNLSNITTKIVANIQKAEKRLDMKSLSKSYHYHLAPCIEAWMRKEDFDKLMRYTDADEGGIIRNFRMAVQIMREILDTSISSASKEKVKKAIYLINRDVIDAERQLRI
ncbi:DEAD/DEAH box helicase [Candidatus Omnitrophota bacterium]